MRFITRAEWGARPSRSRETFTNVEALLEHDTTGATLGAELSDDWVRNIQNFHMDTNGWNDIAYSFLYDSYGNVFEGRGWNVVGAHTVGWNSRAHAFAFLGNGDLELTPEALEAARWLVQEHDHRFGVRPIKGHRDVNQTHCPGDWIHARMQEFRDGTPVAPEVPIPSPTVINPAPVSSYPPFLGLLLHRGSKGQQVAIIQQRLRDRGWAISVDGDFGPATEKVVRGFQADKHLGVDGVVGPATWRAAFELPVT